MTTINKKLVIVSGSTGDLGRAYLNHYSKQDNTICYGLTRRDEQNPVNGVIYCKSDLEEVIATKEQIQKISLEDITEVLLVHPVGKFKFEYNGTPEIDYKQDGIDDEVLASNVNTFHNIVRPLIEQRKTYETIPLTLVAFGSLSDQYSVPWWGSYSKSKLILRKDMSELSQVEQSVKSLFVNLSSVRTANENKTRPHANSTYWINPEEIVAKSVQTIEEMKHPYQEIDIFKPSPNYQEGYYKDFDTLRQKWLREMKGERQNE